MSTAPPASTLHLPRLLFLHGGGVNSLIYYTQCRTLLPLLTPHFRCVFADGPFLCPPHDDVITVYGAYGPFRRWLRWKDSHAAVDAASALDEITYCIRSAMEDDSRQGADGDWVGIVGFSQGAKVALSLLLEQQDRERDLGEGMGVGTCGIEGVRWRFGVVNAGSAPLVALDPERQTSRWLAGVEGIGIPFEGPVGEEVKVGIPTFHVHGLLDPGLELHRRLLREYCKEGSATKMEWEGAHRIPLKGVDVKRFAEGVFEVARRTGMNI